ncbi:MAG: hypothetical protein AB7U85_09845 [Alphaproteobacteria bacterium]
MSSNNAPEFIGLNLDGKKRGIDFDHARRQNAASHISDRKFRKELKTILELPEKRVRSGLREFVFRTKGLNNLNTQSLILLTHKFRELGDFNSIIKIYEMCNNEQFRNSPVGMENVANAYCRFGKYNEAIDMCRQLITKGNDGRYLRHNIEGSAWYMKATSAEALLFALGHSSEGQIKSAKKRYLQNFPNDENLTEIEANGKKAKIRSLISFQKGFRKNMDSSAGLKTAMLYAELGQSTRAEQFAELTLLVCEKHGGLELADYQRAETMTLAACLAGVPARKADDFVNKLKETPATYYQRRITFYELANVRSLLLAQNQKTELVEAVIQKLFTNSTDITKTNNDVLTVMKDAKTDNELTAEELLYKKTFNYRSLPDGFITSNSVAGNFNFNGQVPDHSVGRVDWEQFNRLLDIPVEMLIDDKFFAKMPEFKNTTLRNINDPNTFSYVADQIVRSAFVTEERGIETLNNDNYDRHVQAVTFLSGIGRPSNSNKQEAFDEKVASDSTTSITTTFALGLGDCRHHAQAKQLLCDVWQRDKMNQELGDAIFAALKDDDYGYAEAINCFLNHLGSEFKTYDMEIMAPIDPARRKDGFFLAKESQKIEEHTGMIKFDFNVDFIDGIVSRRLKQVELCDPFYQGANDYDKHIYTLNQGVVSPLRLAKDADNNVLLPANYILAFDEKTKKDVSVPVITRPVGYAGNLDPKRSQEIDRSIQSRLRLDYKDTGDNMYLCGLSIPTIDLSSKLINAKKERAQNTEKGRYNPWLENVKVWLDYKESHKELEEKAANSNENKANNISKNLARIYVKNRQR